MAAERGVDRLDARDRAPDPPRDRRAGALRMVAKQDLDSFDPQRAYFGMAWDFMRFYNRTLVTYDTKPGAAGIRSPCRPQPGGPEQLPSWAFQPPVLQW